MKPLLIKADLTAPQTGLDQPGLILRANLEDFSRSKIRAEGMPDPGLGQIPEQNWSYQDYLTRRNHG